MKFFVFAVLSLVGWIQGQDRLNVAVMDFQAQGLSLEEITVLSDRFRGELFNTGKFVVMERAQMDAIMKEQGFQQSGACASDACLVQMGQLLGVDKLVAGSIGRLGSVYMVNTRVIDMATGKIEHSASEDCRCQIEGLIGTMTQVSRKLAQMSGGQAAAAGPMVASPATTTVLPRESAPVAPTPAKPTPPAPAPSNDFRNYFLVKVLWGNTRAPNSYYAKYFSALEEEGALAAGSNRSNEEYGEVGMAFELGLSPWLRIGTGVFFADNGERELHTTSWVSESWEQSVFSLEFGATLVLGSRFRGLVRYDLILASHQMEKVDKSGSSDSWELSTEGVGHRLTAGFEGLVIGKLGLGVEAYLRVLKFAELRGDSNINGEVLLVNQDGELSVLPSSDDYSPGELNMSGGGARLFVFIQL